MDNWIKEFYDEVDGYIAEYKDVTAPLALLYLYSRNELDLIKDIPSSSLLQYNTIAYQNIIDLEKWGFRYSESYLSIINCKSRALVFTTDNQENQFIEVFKPDMQWLRDEYSYSNILFNIYDILCELNRDYIKLNIKQLFKTILDGFLQHFNLNDEITELMVKLLNVQDGIIAHPWAGVRDVVSKLSGKAIYSAAYKNETKKYSLIYKMYSEIIGIKGYFNNSYIPFEIVDFTANYVIVDDLEIKDEYFWDIFRTTVANGAIGVFLATEARFESFKFPEYTYGWSKAEILGKYINRIVFLPKGLILLVVQKKDISTEVDIIDGTNEEKFTSKKILRYIKTGKNCYKLTSEEFNKEDFVFSINKILGNRNKVILKNKIGNICFDTIAISATPFNRVFKDMKDAVPVNFYVNNYSPFLPFYYLSKGKLCNISESQARAMSKVNYLVVDILNESSFQPKIVAITQSIEFIGGNIRIYKIKENLVNICYLISELNKDYFKKQLFPTESLNKSRYITLEDCFVKIPDTSDTKTPIERQKLLLNSEKKEFINQLLQSYDYDIEKIVAEENTKETTFLPYGTKLYGGQYIILESISSGGFGKTYKAKYIGNDSKQFAHTVAIKEFFDDKFQKRAIGTTDVINPSNHMKIINDVRNKFFKEAEKIKEFSDCDNIVKVYEVFDENNTSYYSMEYIEGKSLQNYVPRDGALEEAEAVHIIRQVAHALKRMHSAKMFHLDVKPSNIMIADDGRVVLIDFGTAHRNLEKISDCSTVLNIKSNGYSPREEIKYADETYDIYSLGATLLYMLGCIKEDKEESRLGDYEEVLPKTLASISKEIQQCIDKSMQDQQQNRPQNIDEFLAMLPCE